MMREVRSWRRDIGNSLGSLWGKLKNKLTPRLK